MGKIAASQLLVRVLITLSLGPFVDAILSGDWLMALSWSLATGFDTPITYFYPVYFFVLLVHRQLRDDEMCEVKLARSTLTTFFWLTTTRRYGEDWKTYKKLVPYRIIPYVY